MTLTFYIVVMSGGTQLATGLLTVNISTTPVTGTFIPTGGTEVPVTFNSWSSGPNGALDWSFTLTAPNGDFPITPNGGHFTYIFTGYESASGPSGTVNWPLPEKAPVTWGSEPTAEEPLADAQGAS